MSHPRTGERWENFMVQMKLKTIDYEVYLKLQKHCEELERKLTICKNALRTIKHTDCDTYKVSARALADTKEVDKDGE